jgi:cytochrome c biogenesis protein CcdA/thiol-disulfide isomerase/thioredoxin
MILLYLFAFLAGLVTILAPCIWPVLPIVLSSSVAGRAEHRRPLGITLGIMLSFTIFTLTLPTLVRLLHFDANILRILAVIVIAFLGLTMLIPALSTRFELFISGISSRFSRPTNRQESGFGPGFITGLSLGIVWTPCAGPVFTAVAVLASTGHVTLDVIFVTLFYVLGIGIPLFAIATGGQGLLTRVKGISKYTGPIQRVFGVIMILAAFAIYTNYDQTLQLQLLATFPKLGVAVNGFENSHMVQNQLADLKVNPSGANSIDTSSLFNADTPAPDFAPTTQWLNTNKPLTIQDLKGKVVLVDFWTYTCINCIRTLPHVTSWYDKYESQGFVVIGVHTPEFSFEQNTNNVKDAIKQDNIRYPVVQDNNYATWTNYQNNYWPAEYLIDKSGTIRRTDFGEGQYDQMEMAIQTLLKDAGHKVNAPLDTHPDQTPQNQISPETYLGSERMQGYYPSNNVGSGQQNFTLSSKLIPNTFSFGGQWTITGADATTGKDATLNYNFIADKVFITLQPGSSGEKAKIYLDGKLIDAAHAGQDVHNGIVTIDQARLYSIVDLRGGTENHIVTFEFQTPGVQTFTFTFG